MTDDNPENVAACFDPAQGCYMVTFDTYQEAKAEIYRLTAALKTARAEALREAAYVARHACLVPPDGGSPSEAEAELCAAAERRILALTKTGGDV